MVRHVYTTWIVLKSRMLLRARTYHGYFKHFFHPTFYSRFDLIWGGFSAVSFAGARVSIDFALWFYEPLRNVVRNRK